MITRLSHANLYVLDYDQAIDFYVNTLGFQLRNNFKMDNGFRWVTVSPPNQPDLEIVLYEPRPVGQMDQDSADQLRALLEKGMLGGGVFETDDCHRAYEDLKAKGVEFVQPPRATFYGIEALFKDVSGNWFSLTQRLQTPPRE